jgi:uncharacterized NAD(P)/FAD-binding protein YdhS
VTRLVIVGGGVAGACVLLRLAELTLPPPFEVVLIDRDGEPGGGLPYARGIDPGLLVNDDVRTMDRTGIGFTPWLQENLSTWWPALAADPNPRVARWCAHNREAIDAGRLEGLFLPRFLFGDFIRERVRRARARLHRQGVRTRLLTHEVRGIHRADDGGWLVALTGGNGTGNVRGDVVLLCVGSLPPAPSAAAGLSGYFVYPDGVPPGDAALTELLDAARSRRRVVVLGASAAASEALYTLADTPAIDEVLVLSRAGHLPDGLPSAVGTPFRAERLTALRASWENDRTGPTAAALATALSSDVVEARAVGYTSIDVGPVIATEFNRVFPVLPPAEKRRFVETYYRQHRLAVRRTSPEYATALIRLGATGTRIETRHTEVTEVDAAEDGGIRVRCGERSLTAPVVYDCRGFADVRATRHELVLNLVRTGVAAVNRSGRGLAVDTGFQAASGLFVLGPLLAGTSYEGCHIWTLENVPTIYRLAEQVATHALHHLTTDAGRTVGTGHRR